jgi:hypothetical protein
MVTLEAVSRLAAKDRTKDRYSWFEGYLEWLEGKEERAGFYSRLEEELAAPKG